MAAVEAALVTEDKTLVIVAQKDMAIDEPTFDDLYHVGTLASIKKMERAEGGYQIIVQGIERVELVEAAESKPLLKVRVHPMPEPTDEGTEIKALARAMLDQAAAVHAILQPQAPFTVEQMFSQVKDPLHQAYLLASMLNLDVAKAQALLEAATRADALRLVHEHLTHELQVLELRQKINSQAQSELSREQKEYLLRQQLRAIQEELGEHSPEQADAAELRRRFEETDLPENVAQGSRSRAVASGAVADRRA